MRVRACQHRLGRLLLPSVLALAVAWPAAAAEPQHDFALPGGTLERALLAYAQRTGDQLLYASELVAGRHVPPLRGRLPADEALSRLLAGSGLVAERKRPNVIVLTRPGLRGDETGPAGTALPAAPGAETLPPAPSALDDETIVVTGTNIRGVRPGASPLLVLDREAIDRSGHATVADALASLPQNFSGTASEDTSLTGADRTVPNTGLGTGINLRGLGSDATLTLVNGRRTAGSGGKGDFTDLSLIPSGAVERVEVLTDGASALYGSDAVGGVVNIHLRRRVDGGETRLRAGTLAHGGAQDYLASQLLGTRWASGHVIAAYEFQHRESLPISARRYTRSADLRPLGGSDWRLFAARPGTLVVVDPVTRGLVPAFAIPADQPGTALAPADFRPGANLESPRIGSDLLPRQRRHSAYLAAEQALGDISLYAEGRYAHRRFGYATSPATALLTVTRANPFYVNPTGAPTSLIAYSFFEELGPARVRGRVASGAATLGARADLAAWQVDAYLSGAEERTRSRTDNLVNTTALSEALGATPDDPATSFSAARDGFFNPFGDLAPNGPQILDFIGSAFLEDATRSRLLFGNVKADGPLFELPGGPVRLAIGAAGRREQFDRSGANFFTGTRPTPLQVTDADRRIGAAFAELAVPLVGSANARAGLHRLDLSVAVRHERYSDFGATTDPKLGLVWAPIEGLNLRGSYGTSFRAPALREVRDAVRISATQLTNPAGNPTLVLLLSGGNPDLEAEQARSYTLGLQAAPAALPGFSAELTYFRTRFSDRIAQPASESILLALRDPSLSPFVTAIDPATSAADLARASALIATPGSLVPANLAPSLFRAIVDARFVNTAEVTVRGLDAQLRQTFKLGGADGALGLNLSYLFDFAEALTPAAAPRERAGTVGNPADLRLRATVSIDGPRLGGTVGLAHVGDLTDDLSQPRRRVDAWTTIDAQLRYRLGGERGSAGTQLAVNVQNLLGSPPPFVDRNTGIGYDATNADPQGRVVSLQLTQRW